MRKYIPKARELSITRGKVHDYLGMTIDYSEPGKVKFKMDDYVERFCCLNAQRT